MVGVLGGGDGRCSSVHGTASLLLAAPRPGVRALDREADPVEVGRVAGDSAATQSRMRSAFVSRAPGAVGRPSGCPTARFVTLR
jgi:hypothetical protein